MKVYIPLKRIKNLVPYPFHQAKWLNKSYFENGLAIIDNNDGSITVDGTAIYPCYYYFNLNKPIKIEKGTWYRISGCPNDSRKYYFDFDIVTQCNCEHKCKSKQHEKCHCKTFKCREDAYINNLRLAISQNAALRMVTFKPQIEEGIFTTDFEQVQWKQIDFGGA